MNTILRKITFPSGFELQLIQGNITQADVECIVNPANQFLKHGGGLAGLLAKKAGPALQKESNAWVKEQGHVTHHSPAYTGGGNLPFRYIIHAVGPVWGSGDEQAKLSAAVIGSIKLAEELGSTSLALPAISTGIFGYPLEEAANVILEAILAFTSEHTPVQLKMIQLILFDNLAADKFGAAWDQIIT